MCEVSCCGGCKCVCYSRGIDNNGIAIERFCSEGNSVGMLRRANPGACAAFNAHVDPGDCENFTSCLRTCLGCGGVCSRGV